MANQDQSPQQVQNALGERIRALRKERKWSQKTFAGLAGTSTYKLSQIEHGNVNLRLSMLLSIAQAFDIKIPELLHGVA